MGDPSSDNWLVAPKDFPSDSFSIRFFGSHNILVCGFDSALHGRIEMRTTGALMVLGDRTGIGSVGRINIFGNGDFGLLFVGARTSMNSVSFFVLGDRSSLIVGEDCTLASGITMRTNDDHAIIDMTSGKHLNPTRNIHIDRHVWVCPEVTVLGDVRIGFGAVIGVKSVTRDVAAFTLVGGQPNRVLRENISWDRSPLPHPDRAKALRNWYTEFSKSL